MIANCGCNGEISGHHLDGEPYIERTVDIGFCPLHKAAPKLLAVLERIKDIIDRPGTQALQEFFEEIVSELPAVNEAIADAKGETA